LVSLAGIPILIGVVGIMGRAVVSRAMKHRYAMGRAAEIMKWTLNSLDTVKLLRGETKQSLKFQAALQDVYACGLCLYNTFNLQVSLGKTILLVAFTAGVYFGAILVEENRITAGAAVFVIYSSLTIAQQLAGLSQNLMTVQRGFGSADSLLKICGSSEERHKEFKRSIGMHPRSSRGAVSFFGVRSSRHGCENLH
jgi:ABC-type bacteriocin/lantibiotic exporter with double-glycine peptidase domain